MVQKNIGPKKILVKKNFGQKFFFPLQCYSGNQENGKLANWKNVYLEELKFGNLESWKLGKWKLEKWKFVKREIQKNGNLGK